MIRFLRTSIVVPSVMVFTLMTLWLPTAQAAMLGTGSASHHQSAASHDEAIESFLTREEVRHQLEQLGVDPEMAIARASSLTPAERAELAEKINELPAGAGVIEVVGIVFIVLLILELVGVTDIFKKF